VEPAIPFTARDLLPVRIQALAPALDALTGLGELQRLYERRAQDSYFPTAALETLGIGVAIADDDLARVPGDGPLVIAANHPHGAADGLALAHALRAVRSDVKLLATELLARIPELRDHLITVDIFNQGAGRNGAAMRAAAEWLRDGHALVIFPAGEVSHVSAADGRIVDGTWRAGVARLATRTDAPVLPVFIEGRNSTAFVTAGRLHGALRTLLLPRELLRLRGQRVRVHVGRMVPAHRLLAIGGAAAQTAYLRARTYGQAGGASPRSSALRLLRGAARPEPVAEPMPEEALAREVDALPCTARLLDTGPWAVLCAEAVAIPGTLQEIGRLRELTFRNVGEGTGRARDLDRYDEHYAHLFVWHRERRRIAGAYRVARADRVAARHSVSGLYTRSLFRYPRRLLSELGPALELGRSFVAPEFQRDFQPLLLLWRGIGALVAAEPRYRVLFGPVSISAEYGHVTRQILARFLLANRYSARLGALVRPKRPLPQDVAGNADVLVRSTVASRVEDIDEIVRELESGRRGIPVLLRQYLKLNAKLLGFSVDPAFGHVLDGLVVVDLLDIDRAMLVRYLGKEGAARFLAWHRAQEPIASPRPVAAPATA
jgi:putative hemolysin